MDTQKETEIREAVDAIVRGTESNTTKTSLIMLIIIDDVAQPEYERGRTDGQYEAV